MREPHLDAFAFVPRLLEGFGASERSGDITGALIDAAGNLANRCVGAASGFEGTRRAVPRAATIEKCGPIIDKGAARRQSLPRRADIRCRRARRNGTLHA